MIEDFERQEMAKDKEVEEERLKYISLRNQLSKLEGQLRKKVRRDYILFLGSFVSEY